MPFVKIKTITYPWFTEICRIYVNGIVVLHLHITGSDKCIKCIEQFVLIRIVSNNIKYYYLFVVLFWTYYDETRVISTNSDLSNTFSHRLSLLIVLPC